MSTLPQTPSGLPRRTPALMAKQPHGVHRSRFIEIVDRHAHDELKDQLGSACEALYALGANPAIVAASNQRFNDAGYDGNWRVVRVGTEVYEKSEYEGTGHDTPGDIEAWRIIKQLEKRGWRQAFSKAFDLRFEDHILALVIQDGLAWLVFCATNYGSGSHVFAIWEDGDIAYYGDCLGRFDQAIFDTRSPPLKFAAAINPPDFWPYSTASEWYFETVKKRLAKAQSERLILPPQPQTQSGQTWKRLGYQLLISVALALALLTGAGLILKALG